MTCANQTFETFGTWVDNASRWLTLRDGREKPVCVDATGRRCRNGADFMRARDEGAFPVRWYWPEQILGARLDCMVSDAVVAPDPDAAPTARAPESEDDRLTRAVMDFAVGRAASAI